MLPRTPAECCSLMVVACVCAPGFADIPTGPSCPYIVRRGLLGTAVVPGPQKPPDQEEETD